MLCGRRGKAKVAKVADVVEVVDVAEVADVVEVADNYKQGIGSLVELCHYQNVERDSFLRCWRYSCSC